MTRKVPSYLLKKFNYEITVENMQENITQECIELFWIADAV